MVSVNIKNILITTTLVLSCLSASAAAKASVAYVDMRTVIEGSKHFAQMQQDMQKTLGPKHQELLAAQKEMESEQETLTKQKAVMASATFKKKQDVLSAKQTKLAERERAFQDEVMKMQDASMKKLYGAVKDAAKEIATQKGFDVVLQGEPLYIANNGDITSQVKSLVEKKKI